MTVSRLLTPLIARTRSIEPPPSGIPTLPSAPSDAVRLAFAEAKTTIPAAMTHTSSTMKPAAT